LGRHRASDTKVLGVVAEQHRQQRGLTRAVSSDESDLFAVTNDEGHGLEETTRADLNPQVTNDKHLAT
jgi:hypothetical protein